MPKLLVQFLLNLVIDFAFASQLFKRKNSYNSICKRKTKENENCVIRFTMSVFCSKRLNDDINNIFHICFSDPSLLVECASFASLGKIQPFTMSVSSNTLLLMVRNLLLLFIISLLL